MHLCKEIETFEDLEEWAANEGYELPAIDPCDGPCYQEHIADTEALPKECSVGEFMSLISANAAGDRLFTYSVTANEPNYLEWVELAMSIPGSTVAVVKRPHATCYFCCVPNTPDMELV